MAHFKDLIVGNVIHLFGKLTVNKDVTCTGIVDCGEFKLADVTLGNEKKAFYITNGELTQSGEYVVEKQLNFYDTKPSGSYFGTQNMLNGTVSIINFYGNTRLYTNPSSEHGNGIELYSYCGQSYPTLRFLTDKNWMEMIVLDDSGDVAGDGTIFLQRNGQTIGSFTLNQSKNTTIDIPPSVRYKLIDGNYKTQFKTQTYGSNSSATYLSVIRNNVANVANAPQYSSGLAWTKGDNNAYFMPSYSTSTAYIGGGNGEKINWVNAVAWYENIPSMSSKMDKSGSNATSAAFKTIADNNSTSLSTAITTDHYDTLGYVNDTLSTVSMSDIADYLATKTTHNVYAIQHINKQLIIDTQNNKYTVPSYVECWFNLCTASIMYQYDRTPINVNVNLDIPNQTQELKMTKSFIYIDRDLGTQSRKSSIPSGVISTSKLSNLRLVFRISTPTTNLNKIYFQGFETNVTNLFGNNMNNVEFPSTAITIPSSALKLGTSSSFNFVELELTFHIDWTSSQIAANTSSGCFNRTSITYQWL